MIYLKAKKEEFGELLDIREDYITIEIYDDMFYTYCPRCGKEQNLDIKYIEANLKSGGSFDSTTYYCSECDKKGIVKND